eukprot:3231460-Pleurochrysis_carterae.AAC.2
MCAQPDLRVCVGSRGACCTKRLGEQAGDGRVRKSTHLALIVTVVLVERARGLCSNRRISVNPEPAVPCALTAARPLNKRAYVQRTASHLQDGQDHSPPAKHQRTRRRSPQRQPRQLH